jgi:Di-haem oxidoreductase, putative peroxidase
LCRSISIVEIESTVNATSLKKESFMGYRERCVRAGLLLVGITALAWTLTVQHGISAAGQAVDARDRSRRDKFTAATAADEEAPARGTAAAAPVEALAAFDNLTNGFTTQRDFDENRETFEEVEGIADGLGPTYNAQSCRECHQNVVTGGASQVTEQRTGHLTGGRFFDSQGGSLIASRATHPDATELVAVGDDIRTFRISTNVLGAGLVEAVANSALTAIRDAQPPNMRGLAVTVPILERPGQTRIGRFGWKSQHGSLHSFAADAYLNEMGITSPLMPTENTVSGRDIAQYDTVADPEDDGDDVVKFADFMRATKAPPRGEITAAVQSGEEVFNGLGCNTCHTPTLVTAAPGTIINGGAMTVPASLGNKVIHPYSDYLLHDIGTSDGIPIQPTDEFVATASRMRTAPLWGLRTRNRLMHDGLTFTREDAILRHAGQAVAVTNRYRNLSSADKSNLVAFLNSL